MNFIRNVHSDDAVSLGKVPSVCENGRVVGRQELKQAIQDAQEDTLNAMSDLVHEVYNMHEKRIRNIEHHVGLTSTH
jgi:ABC-type phosphate transport system auxiliary subunit